MFEALELFWKYSFHIALYGLNENTWLPSFSYLEDLLDSEKLTLLWSSLVFDLGFFQHPVAYRLYKLTCIRDAKLIFLEILYYQ